MHHTLHRDKRDVAREIEQTRQELNSIFQHSSTPAPGKVKQAVDGVKRKASALTARATDQMQLADARVRENIYMGLGVAAVCGFVVGFLASRRKNRRDC
jgi:ElaB/YqjD/DUF883 family membrane-anchored ribosome-binding protein